MRKVDKRLFLLIAATTGFATFGFVLLYSAFSFGSVVLASSLSAIQPTIVFLYSAILNRIRPGVIPSERTLGGWATARKVGAVILIIIGVLALTGA